MEAYLQIFEKKFENPTREQLQQLTFLARADGRIHLRRRVLREAYRPAGIGLIEKRPASWVHRLVLGRHAE
jgi:hypothetical protein